MLIIILVLLHNLLINIINIIIFVFGVLASVLICI